MTYFYVVVGVVDEVRGLQHEINIQESAWTQYEIAICDMYSCIFRCNPVVLLEVKAQPVLQ